MNEGMPFYWISNKIRIFPNNEKIEFKGPVHEIVEISIKEQGIKIEQTEIPVHHYAQLDEKRSRYKRFFYMNITRKKVLKNPTNAKAYLELGREYFNLRLYHRAVQTFKKGLKFAKKKWLLHELNVQTGNVYEKMKKPDIAEKYFSKAKEIKSVTSEIDIQGVPIIAYHDIGEYESRWVVPFEVFKNQVHFFIKNGYTFITLDYFLTNNFFSKKLIALTFDDGRKSVYRKVYPFLKDQGIKATIFITTDWINGNNIPEKEQYSDFMSWKEIKNLKKQGWVVGSHGKTHKDLTFIDEITLKDELLESKKILGKKIEKKIIHFAYPYGHYNEKIKSKVLDAGYKTISTVDFGFSIHKNNLKRVIMTSNSNLKELFNKI